MAAGMDTCLSGTACLPCARAARKQAHGATHQSPCVQAEAHHHCCACELTSLHSRPNGPSTGQQDPAGQPEATSTAGGQPPETTASTPQHCQEAENGTTSTGAQEASEQVPLSSDGSGSSRVKPAAVATYCYGQASKMIRIVL